MILVDKNTIIIPEETKEFEVLFIKKEFTIPSIQFNDSSPYLLGGLDGNFTITDQIDTSATLVLNVLAFELGEVPEADRRISDLDSMGQVKNFTQRYKQQLGFTYE